MPQFPFKPDPSDLPSELFPEVILPNENGESPNLQSEAETQQVSDADGEHETENEESNEYRFKKRSEAIPEKRKRRRSKTRWELSDPTGEQPSRNFFANDELVSEFRNRFAKPLLVVLGFVCLLGIVYLFKPVSYTHLTLPTICSV